MSIKPKKLLHTIFLLTFGLILNGSSPVAKISHISDCSRGYNAELYKPHLSYKHINQKLIITLYGIQELCSFKDCSDMSFTLIDRKISLDFFQKYGSSISGCICTFNITIEIENMKPGKFEIETPKCNFSFGKNITTNIDSEKSTELQFDKIYLDSIDSKIGNINSILSFLAENNDTKRTHESQINGIYYCNNLVYIKDVLKYKSNSPLIQSAPSAIIIEGNFIDFKDRDYGKGFIDYNNNTIRFENTKRVLKFSTQGKYLLIASSARIEIFEKEK